ncbi:MAG: phosphoenolpyruvate--protein phosphotransferase [Propionibacteriaceae bacterium]|jgi:phosphotransferase system enzyme I (PtsI)|nr:phosphoenolpyruvate--protein phosphotransferase [Propionibacteriaceae bacterium]
METIIGKGVCGGICFGPVYYLEHRIVGVTRQTVDDVPAELARFQRAKDAAVVQLGELYQEALPKVGAEGAAIFEVHQMMAEDLDYLEAVQAVIETQRANAEYAVTATGKNFAQLFANMDDPYMRGRAADVLDVSGRIVSELTGQPQGGIKSEVPVILAAGDLSPSETIQLDKAKILAFVTAEGSANSHTAILARTLGIPAVIQTGASLTKALHGRQAAVDGTAGVLFVEPDESVTAELRAKADEARRKKELLEELKGQTDQTLDGRVVEVFANVNHLSELPYVLQNDASGIGLFRSEFIYLDAHDYPDENEQFNIYKTVAQTLASRKVVFRTMDIGADKMIPYFNLEREENPALGLRGARLSLARPELLRTQLRALFRAASYGNVSIMFPMIAAAWEVLELKAFAERVQAELRDEGTSFGQAELGIMIETPAAALASAELAPLVDFFSVGTNDLTQYTLAVDRQNDRVDRFCDTHHPAVLKLIEMAAKAAHDAGIWIGVCGELAADLSITETLLRLGVDELSVSPAVVLELRAHVRSLDLGGAAV